jgi:hypothetical protein
VNNEEAVTKRGTTGLIFMALGDFAQDKRIETGQGGGKGGARAEPRAINSSSDIIIVK